MEEVIVVGNAKHTFLQPLLKVASPDVQASHGARIHKLSSEQLFYMQSKGIALSSAIQMLT
ncbi:MAG: SufD family Fe-S cluster assembly protein [Candidatus Peribacteria bacterium]|nr:SufD family Fe-S cluster assembly protein [Candidatus Peribacteria bacterium]